MAPSASRNGSAAHPNDHSSPGASRPGHVTGSRSRRCGACGAASSSTTRSMRKIPAGTAGTTAPACRPRRPARSVEKAWCDQPSLAPAPAPRNATRRLPPPLLVRCPHAVGNRPDSIITERFPAPLRPPMHTNRRSDSPDEYRGKQQDHHRQPPRKVMPKRTRRPPWHEPCPQARPESPTGFRPSCRHAWATRPWTARSWPACHSR